MRSTLFFLFAFIAGCAAAEAPKSVSEVASGAVAPWTYDDNVDRLRQASCPARSAFKTAREIELTIEPIDVEDADSLERNLTNMTWAGAWHLKSDMSEFGGLSGLAILPSGSLLAVSDGGQFVWIGMDREMGAPDGTASISKMLNLHGQPFPTKSAGDAEGLTVRDGVAFVSFEQTHRIDAFDLERCESQARAAPVAQLNDMVDGHRLRDNRGAEGLAMADASLIVGFEVHDKGGSPIGLVLDDGDLAHSRRTSQPGLYLLTGLDRRDDRTAVVFRSYDPVRGARAIIRIEDDGDVVAEAKLQRPLPVDNFEGIALSERADGGVRVWLISDDNFSDRQKTILLAIDIDS